MDMMQLLEMLKKQSQQSPPLAPQANPYGMAPQSFNFAESPFPATAPQPQGNGLPPRNRSDIAPAPAPAPATLQEVNVPQREKIGIDQILPEVQRQSEFTAEGLGVEAPEREKKSGLIDKPFHKDNDRMAMMLAAMSDGFGGMTLRGKNGMGTVNKLTMANAQQNMKNNKTMDYLVQNNPEMAKKMMSLPPEMRDKYMDLAMKSSFAAPDESAFAEKVRMLEATGVPRDQAVSQVLSGAGTNITVSTGGGAKPFETKLGESAADWISGRNVASRGNRREATRVIGDLEKSIANGEAVTGSFASYFPESVRNLIDSEGLDMQQSVERIVQQSLKETLGAQFAQKEAEQLFARTWNPKARPEVNLRRTKRLLSELDAYAANMDHIANGMLQSDGNILKYLQENPLDSGSLFGGSIYDIEYEEPYDAGTLVQKPSEVSQSDWDLLNDEEKELFR